MVTGAHLNSIARSDNYLIGGVLWTHPEPFHDGDDNYDDDNYGDEYDRMVMMVVVF